MVLKLYSMDISNCGRRVAAILHEMKIPYELVQPASVSDIKGVEWTNKQPFGQMPYIDDDGFILFESRAIAKYLATKYSSSGVSLLPNRDNLKEVALFDQAVSVEMTNFDPYAGALFREKVYKHKWNGIEPDAALVTNFEAILAGKMDGFERLLGRQRYMAGESLTIVDFFYCPYGNAFGQMGYDYLTNEEKYPNIVRWWKEVSTRDSWLAVKDGVPTSL